MTYLKYITKRIVVMMFTLVTVSILIFFLIRLAGVDPISVMTGEQRSTEAQREQLREEFHLNDTLPEQYLIWISGVLHGDLGVDYIQEQSVMELIKNRIPVTVGLVIMSSFFALILAIPFGVISAIRKNTWIDHSLSFLMLLLTSMPGFVTSIFILVIMVKLNPQYSFNGTFHNTSEYLQRLFIPSVALSFSMTALIGRITRNSMVEQLKQGYIITARSKGMSAANIIFKHAFHNGVIPVLTISSLLFGGCIANAVLVEEIFALPGLGSMLIMAIQNSNYPIIQALVLILLTVFITINLLVDILYVLIDPRIKLK